VKIKRQISGFTLIELLVTFAILSLLASVALGQYRTSQMKARDAQRKSDLANVARALEMYYNDNQAYPASGGGLIQVDRGGSLVNLNWGSEFSTDEVIYMKILPQDPHSDDGVDYCYESNASGSYYRLFAKLENNQDPNFFDEDDDGVGDYTCYDSDDTPYDGYSYGLSSSNVAVDRDAGL